MQLRQPTPTEGQVHNHTHTHVTLLGILQVPSLSIFFDGSRFSMLNKPNAMKSHSLDFLAWPCVLSHPPSITPVCFWLVAACKISNGSHLRPSSFLFLYFFLSFNLLPQSKKNTPPYTLHPGRASSPSSLPLLHQLLVDCCVLQPNSGHLGPRPHPCLHFLMHLNSASQPREPAAARANPPPGACNRLVGSSSTMIGAMADVAIEI
jgi:hypothetical protein